MIQKSVPISVRITDEDAEFLSRLRIPGAVTPSEKFRSLLSESKKRHEGLSTYGEALAYFSDMLIPAVRKLQKHERETGTKSEVVHLLAHWLPETMAFLSSALLNDDQPENDTWRDLEAGLADRAFVFVQSLLRLGVTSKCEAFDPDIVSDRLDGVTELLEIVKQIKRRDGKKK